MMEEHKTSGKSTKVSSWLDWSTFSREGSTLAEPDDIPSSDHPVVQNTLFEILLRLKADLTKNPEILESFRLS